MIKKRVLKTSAKRRRPPLAGPLEYNYTPNSLVQEGNTPLRTRPQRGQRHGGGYMYVYIYTHVSPGGGGAYVYIYMSHNNEEDGDVLK